MSLDKLCVENSTVKSIWLFILLSSIASLRADEHEMRLHEDGSKTMKTPTSY